MLTALARHQETRRFRTPDQASWASASVDQSTWLRPLSSLCPVTVTVPPPFGKAHAGRLPLAGRTSVTMLQFQCWCMGRAGRPWPATVPEARGPGHPRTGLTACTRRGQPRPAPRIQQRTGILEGAHHHNHKRTCDTRQVVSKDKK